MGSSGFRIIAPNCKPISTLLLSVGGTNMMLGLYTMATTAECLYASVKALVCTFGGNNVALKDMEKSGSFKVSGMFHGRIKGQHCIYIQYTYKCTIYTTIIHM